MLFIADAMRDSPNNPVVGLVDYAKTWPPHQGTLMVSADRWCTDYPGPARHLESAYSAIDSRGSANPGQKRRAEANAMRVSRADCQAVTGGRSKATWPG